MSQRGFAPIVILVLAALAAAGFFGYKYIQNKIPDGSTFPVEWATSSPSPDPTTKFLGEEIPQISENELGRGWYWGNSDQKKPGTPRGWVYTKAGKSSCWHSFTSSCGQ